MDSRQLMLVIFCSSALLFGGEFDSIKGSLGKLRNNDPSAAEEIKADSVAMRLVMQRIDPASTPWKLKLVATEWLLRAHLLKVRLQPSESSNKVMLSRAWDLISVASAQSGDVSGQGVSGSLYRGADARSRLASATQLNDSVGIKEIPAEVQEALTWLSVEVSARLGDPEKMKVGLKAFTSKPSKDSRTQAFALMAAFHTGDWGLANQLEKSLKSQPKLLQGLHEQSFRDPQVFDYAALSIWCENSKPAPFSGELKVRQFQLKQYRYRLKDVVGADPGKVAKAKAENSSDWQSPSTPGILHINGAVAHWSMPFGNQLPLSGAVIAEKVSLLGYADEPAGRFVDILELHRDAKREKVWMGTLTSKTPGNDGLSYLFDVETELEETKL